MNAISRGTGRLLLSAMLSVALSAGATLVLRMILTAAMKPAADDQSQMSTEHVHRPGPPRGANINPVAVLVFMPLLFGNSNNNFGPNRSFVGRRDKRKG